MGLLSQNKVQVPGLHSAVTFGVPFCLSLNPSTSAWFLFVIALASLTVNQAARELMAFPLPLSPERWAYRHVPSSSALKKP